ncbi:hypothetical protein M0P48_01685 [Candidatus Gracilibacteria bacterium]|jgi:hypothetical protein|nr:hypothetical protein [Candidatus Gracilibacteria bacterium]
MHERQETAKQFITPEVGVTYFMNPNFIFEGQEDAIEIQDRASFRIIEITNGSAKKILAKVEVMDAIHGPIRKSTYSVYLPRQMDPDMVGIDQRQGKPFSPERANEFLSTGKIRASDRNLHPLEAINTCRRAFLALQERDSKEPKTHTHCE